MDTARQSNTWGHAANLLSAILTAGQAAGSAMGAKFKKPPPTPDEINPFAKGKQQGTTQDGRPQTREEARRELMSLVGM